VFGTALFVKDLMVNPSLCIPPKPRQKMEWQKHKKMGSIFLPFHLFALMH